MAWRPLRRGIADLHRRAEVGRKATERYLDALASIDQDTTLHEVLHRLGQPQYWHGRRVRALSPFAPDDRQLLQAISRGEFTLNGIRNRDLQRLSFAHPATTPAEARRRSGLASRKLHYGTHARVEEDRLRSHIECLQAAQREVCSWVVSSVRVCGSVWTGATRAVLEKEKLLVRLAKRIMNLSLNIKSDRDRSISWPITSL